MLPIIEDFIPVGRRNRPRLSLAPGYITIHDTANTNKGANALAHAKYLKGDAAAKLPVSWHFTVDDKRIIQHLPLDEVGWHAGDGRGGPGNRSSIGVEICENADGDRAKAEQNAAELAASLLRQFGLGLDKVMQHAHWAKKNCPRILRNRPGGWENFLKEVAAMAGGEPAKPATGGEVSPPAAGTPIMGEAVATVQQARALLRQKALDWVLMADLYYSIAPKYGIRADVALAQACKETGYFKFGGLVQPGQWNFAGLGATGVGYPGASFPDRATGVEAHIQHLYAYATTDPLPAGAQKVDPRFDLVKRGTAPYVEYLGAAENPAGVGWAYPGKDYGHSIVRDYLTPMLAVKVAEVPTVDARVEELLLRVRNLTAENEQLRKQAEASASEVARMRGKLKQIAGLAAGEA